MLKNLLPLCLVALASVTTHAAEFVIAENGKKDPFKTGRGAKTPLALLGTVKGVCDFLREYVGVRFLFAGSDGFNKDGFLKIDTRSLAFIPVTTIRSSRLIGGTGWPRT